MYQTNYSVRVRYGETDRMGVLYHGHYATFYEIARTDAIRKLGITYRELEEAGILMPVTDLSMKFLAPALYDEVVEVISTIPELPAIRMTVVGEMRNTQGDVINRSEVKLTFLDAASRRILHAPDALLDPLRPYF